MISNTLITQVDARTATSYTTRWDLTLLLGGPQPAQVPEARPLQATSASATLAGTGIRCSICPPRLTVSAFPRAASSGPRDGWVIEQNPGPNQQGPSTPATGRHEVKASAMLSPTAMRREGRNGGHNRLAGAG